VAPGSYTAGAIVLLSDGRRTTGPDPIAAAKLAANLGVRVYTVGFGTKEGAEIPGAEGMSFYARLDEETLRAVASITAAEYFHAGTAADLKKVYANLSLKFALESRETEVSALLAGAAALLALLAAMLSLAWFHRRDWSTSR
jgi:Ca-activated chloride channel family protein